MTKEEAEHAADMKNAEPRRCCFMDRECNSRCMAFVPAAPVYHGGHIKGLCGLCTGEEFSVSEPFCERLGEEMY